MSSVRVSLSRIFDTLDAAQKALRALATDWVTGKSGRHGGNKTRQHHGGPHGCFMITADKTTKIATLWKADSNDEDLPDVADMEGAREIEEEEIEDDDADEAQLNLSSSPQQVSL